MPAAAAPPIAAAVGSQRPLGLPPCAGDNAGTAMRRAALLLLLLVLPGLLLPAGSWLHVCRCAIPMAAQPAACCAAAGDEAAPSCCGGTSVRGPAPALAAEVCRCEWLALPDLGDEPATPPEAPLEPAGPVALPAAPLALPTAVLLPAHRRWSPRLQRPPPHPYACRNLPLRI
jgi:hypothetical protein